MKRLLIIALVCLQSTQALALCKDEFLALEKSNKVEFVAMKERLAAISESKHEACAFYREELLPKVRVQINGYMERITCYYKALEAAVDLEDQILAMKKDATKVCAAAGIVFTPR
ncbi:MAG: hypothetical protein ABL936_12300 [Aestuariivirga sp.]